MKKVILFLFSSVLSLSVLAQPKIRVEKVDPDTADNQEIVQYRTRANHWSIMGSLGDSRLDGDQVQAEENLFPTTFDKMSGLLNIEYTFSPIWGVYLEYFYQPYGGYSRFINENMDDHSDGNLYKFHARNHEFTLGASVNVLNLFYNCRPQRWQWYLNAGAGVSIYDMREHEKFPEGLPIDNPLIPSDNKADKKDLVSQSKSLSFPIGTTVEWNATRWLAVLANFQYRFHTEDNYDASVRGNDNDKSLFAGLGLRWKINSMKNRHLQHVRDMSMCQFEPNMADENAKEALKRVKAMEPRVDNLERRLDELEPRVDALENDIENLRDSDGDGIHDIRDREPNTPNGVPVNSFGEQVDESTMSDNVDKNCYSIYFNTAKYNIQAVSETTLSEVARKLSADPNLKVLIKSYADEQGEVRGYNNMKLTQNRAKQTRKILIKKYGIDESRIVSYEGFGAVKGAPSIDYLPNRRSDICFVK